MGKRDKKVIIDHKQSSDYSHLIIKIYFFEAGCNTPKSKNNIQFVLSDCFKNATTIIEEDIMVAVYATTKISAVVCIVARGSNCCYINGITIHSKTPSSGFLVMDEGSGNYFVIELFKAHYY